MTPNEFRVLVTICSKNVLCSIGQQRAWRRMKTHNTVNVSQFWCVFEVPQQNIKYHRNLHLSFSKNRLLADSFIESRCPQLCLSVCPFSCNRFLCLFRPHFPKSDVGWKKYFCLQIYHSCFKETTIMTLCGGNIQWNRSKKKKANLVLP